ncbi:MAG: hypothetical protein GX885_07165, partial [Methanomicrobiales archaeon]|nr:hypothetical protein [Methanomicrobiales archaeon]
MNTCFSRPVCEYREVCTGDPGVGCRDHVKGGNMIKKRHLALLCAVIVIGLLIPPVMAVEAAPGEHLYCPLNYAQEHPDIDGNVIVWEDDRNGDRDIYLGEVSKFRADPARGTLHAYTGNQITDDPASQEKPSISGNHIVWQDDRNGDWDIYLYDRSKEEEPTLLTKDIPGKHWMPIVRGNHAAWYHNNKGKTNVILYDIAAGKVKATIDCDAMTTIRGGSTEFKPALSDTYVAWVESGTERVRYYQIANGDMGYASTASSAQSWPSLHGSVIAWEDYRNGNADIYTTDLANPSGKEQKITSSTSGQVSPSISGNLIAWEDERDGLRSIYMYATREMPVFVPGSADDEQLYPVASGNTIVWQRGRGEHSNIYIFVHDPSGTVEPALESIEVTPSSIAVEIGETEKFTATALDQDGKPMT